MNSLGDDFLNDAYYKKDNCWDWEDFDFNESSSRKDDNFVNFTNTLRTAFRDSFKEKKKPVDNSNTLLKSKKGSFDSFFDFISQSSKNDDDGFEKYGTSFDEDLKLYNEEIEETERVHTTENVEIDDSNNANIVIEIERDINIKNITTDQVK